MVATGLTSPLALREVGSGGPGTSLPTGGDFPARPPLSPGRRCAATSCRPTANIRDKAQKIEDSLKMVEKYVNQQKLQLAATPAIMPTRGFLGSFRQPPAPVHRPLRVP